MGKTFKKFDKDDLYHNLKKEREDAKFKRGQKIKRVFDDRDKDDRNS